MLLYKEVLPHRLFASLFHVEHKQIKYRVLELSLYFCNLIKSNVF